MNLREALWGPGAMDVRRLSSLVAGLPVRSAFHWAVDPESAFNFDAVRWGNIEELLALVAEEVDLGNRLYHMRHAKRGATPMSPVRIRRPQQAKEGPKEEERKRQATPSEMREFLGADNIEVTGA